VIQNGTMIGCGHRRSGQEFSTRRSECRGVDASPECMCNKSSATGSELHCTASGLAKDVERRVEGGEGRGEGAGRKRERESRDGCTADAVDARTTRLAVCRMPLLGSWWHWVPSPSSAAAISPRSVEGRREREPPWLAMCAHRGGVRADARCACGVCECASLRRSRSGEHHPSTATVAGTSTSSCAVLWESHGSSHGGLWTSE
jgi:hypothetical protein